MGEGACGAAGRAGMQCGVVVQRIQRISQTREEATRERPGEHRKVSVEETAHRGRNTHQSGRDARLHALLEAAIARSESDHPRHAVQSLPREWSVLCGEETEESQDDQRDNAEHHSSSPD